MTEAEVRAQIDVMVSRINSSVVDIQWNLASLGEPRTRYVWLMSTPYLVYLNDYLSHWWFKTGQIWYDDIDIMVNAVGRIVYELYQSLLSLESKIDAYLGNNVTVISSWTAWAMNKIVDYVSGELDLLENWISLSIDYLYQYVDTEVSQVYTDIDAIITEVHNYVDAEIAKIFVDIDADLDEVKAYVDTEIQTYSATVDLLFSDLYADLDSKVDAINTSINSLATDALDWIIEKVGAVWDWLYDTGNDIYLWIDQKVSDLTNYVSQWVLEITTYVNNLASDVAAGFSRVYNVIGQSVNDMIIYIDGVVDTVKTALQASIDILTRDLDWSNLFFNLALTLPEFGMLSAMTRTDTDFDEYKPFWQAFLSRILST